MHFLGQKELPPSHKQQDHVNEEQNPFRLKEDKFLQRNFESFKLLTHRARMSEKFASREDSYLSKFK